MPAPESTSLFALLSYANTNNIGDEIQSIAAEAFLPRVDDFIDREATDSFHPSDGRRRSLIMNGWYAHNPECWPPSEFIDPMFVSMHISEKPGWFSGLAAKTIYLDGPVAKYLRAYQPIGARDLNTLRLLRQADIEAYFSGCLTLTLERPDVPRDESLVVFCEVPGKVDAQLRCKSRKNIRTTRHIDLHEPNQAKRFEIARNLLRLYASASCVVTSRLHCALPCIAMGTPTLLISAAHDIDRFDGLLDLIHSGSAERICSGDCDYNIDDPPPNPDRYLAFRQNLAERVREFIRAAQDSSGGRPYPLGDQDREEIRSRIYARVRSGLIERTERARRLAAQVEKLGGKPV